MTDAAVLVQRNLDQFRPMRVLLIVVGLGAAAVRQVREEGGLAVGVGQAGERPAGIEPGGADGEQPGALRAERAAGGGGGGGVVVACFMGGAQTACLLWGDDDVGGLPGEVPILVEFEDGRHEGERVGGLEEGFMIGVEADGLRGIQVGVEGLVGARLFCEGEAGLQLLMGCDLTEAAD